MDKQPKMESLDLPAVRTDGPLALERVLAQRRSVRSYARQALTLAQAGQLLWAAQGVCDKRGLRTAPSAGALYPLELHLVAGRVQDLAEGIYRYVPAGHRLIQTMAGDLRSALCDACLRQGAIAEAPASLVICAVYERVTSKYGERGIRYVHMEIGHAAQNVCLQAVALGLDTVVIGALHENRIMTVMGLPKDQLPLYVIPAGRRPDQH